MVDKDICVTCGTQFPSDNLPNRCPICSDDRQFIPEAGQAWVSTTLLQHDHSVLIEQLYPQVYELKVIPEFAIGQRAFLIVTDSGNILWDCIPLLDEQVMAFIRSKGGLNAIAFSHPHYYSNMNEWAAVFDCPVYIHQSDEQWVFFKGPYITKWEGKERSLWEGMRIIHTGGHFPGSAVLHIPFLSPNGVMLCGDSLFIARSKQHIAIQYSYPNHIPLPLSTVQEIYKQLQELPFDTIHGAFSWQNITGCAKEILQESIKRYKI